MTLPNDTKNNVNDSETSGSIDPGLTQDRSGFDLEETRKQLIARRVRLGADTPDGHTCSNLIEQLKNYETAPPDQRAKLEKLIKESMGRLGGKT